MIHTPSKSQLLILLAVVCLLHPEIQAQSFFGSITGTVSDSSGASVPQARVTVIDLGSNERRAADTDAQGSYRFASLKPGAYRVEVEGKGFRRQLVENVIVAVDATVRVDAALQVGDVGQTVQVTAAVPLLQTDSSSVSQVVTGRAVQDLPLNGRNVMNLVALVPGVVPQGQSEGNMTGKNVFAGGNYQIGGGTANQSAAYLDGVPLNTAYGNVFALIPSQDTVAEFRVQTNSSSAEFGRYTGGVINMASKAGTNEFHGGAYEFLRNRVLNAGSFFSNRAGVAKAPFVQNQFGATIGGPIRKNKLFIFGGYEGFRQRQGSPFLKTVPTEAMLQGDFSALRTAAGAVVPIYDPLTQCGAYGNPACAAGALEQRSVFPGNRIPASRINPVAQKLAAFPVWAKPNTQGNAAGNFNFFTNGALGGDNDQINVRGDWNASDNQRLLARYTRWNSANADPKIYGNGQSGGTPESFTTHQAVLAYTNSISANTLLDVRLGFLRFDYRAKPGNQGIDMAGTFGLPSYYKDLPVKNGVPDSTTVPFILASGYDFVGSGINIAADTTYSFTPSLTKIIGRHTLKVGGELRFLYNNYYQNAQPGGSFSFDNIFTSRNASNPGGTGNSIASFLLGYASAGSQGVSPFTAAGQRYQGYFINDSWQIGKKLTVNLGLRWEIPGVFTERFDRQVAFRPDLPNPELTGISVPGRSGRVLGSLVLVNSADHPDRGLRPESYNLFGPRLGIAYRLNERTVIRAGAGINYIPANANFLEGPYANPVNFLSVGMVNTLNGQVTPQDTLSNPYPGGFSPAPGRNAGYQRFTFGNFNRANSAAGTLGYSGQWNFTVQRELPGNVAVEAAYAGLRGVHLPWQGRQLNQIDPQYLALGTQLNQSVPNPFFGIAALGPLSRSTTTLGQLLLPFPQFGSTADSGSYSGNSTYNSLQMKAEKRFGGAGMVLAAFTFSKVISDIETVTKWLDNPGLADPQNWTNLRSEKSLSSYDSRRRMTIAYVNDLPFGKGKRFLPGVKGAADLLISGWGVNGTTTFQDGFPLNFTASPNLASGFNTGLRPNIVAGCDSKIDGAAQDRLGRWFNTSCFAVPAAYTFGNASRTDPVLRSHGINNFDFAVFKRTSITERFKLEFRAEAFNIANRARFGRPNTGATTAANNSFGIVSTQINDPRLIQFGLRLFF